MPITVKYNTQTKEWEVLLNSYILMYSNTSQIYALKWAIEKLRENSNLLQEQLTDAIIDASPPH